MPVRSIETRPSLLRRWVRWLLIVTLVPMVVIATLVEYLAVSWAISGYWGPEWPTAWSDTAVFTVIWLSLVGALTSVAVRPVRLALRRRRRDARGSVRSEPGSP